MLKVYCRTIEEVRTGAGMPDEWEKRRGLDPEDPMDHAKLMASGYTAIEEYCHELAARRIEAGLK